MVPSMVSINCHKYNISHSPEEAMLFIIVKARLQFKNFLFIKALKEYFHLMWGIKQNEKPSSTKPGTFLKMCYKTKIN